MIEKTRQQNQRKRELTPEQLEASSRLLAIWEKRAPILKLTQESAGFEMGMNQSAVYQYLSGRVAIGFEACIKWAQLLECDPAEIRPDVAERVDAMIALRKGASRPTHKLNAARLRACVAQAVDALKKADKFPTPSAIAETAAEIYQANWEDAGS